MPLVYRTGATKLVVYQSEYAGTNKANAVVWDVGDEEVFVTRFKARYEKPLKEIFE